MDCVWGVLLLCCAFLVVRVVLRFNVWSVEARVRDGIAADAAARARRPTERAA
jgi:hypothetical protein